MNPEFFVFGTCGFVVLSILLIPLLRANLKSVTALFLIFLNALLTSVPAIAALLGKSFTLEIFGGPNFGNILLEIDPLSAWFILIVNITLINGAIYGIGYMKAYEKQTGNLSLHWIMFVIFHASMLWVCMLHHGFAFLIAWEIMTLSSLILVMFDHNKANTLQAGVNYLVQMHIGVAFLTLAFIWVFVNQQTSDFQGIAAFLQEQPAYWVILFFFLGFGIKAGFIPLHTWLPYAHPAAPSHVSGVMSGVIVKMGIYGIVRIAMMINTDALVPGIMLMMISAVTTLYGILNASVHRDFKKMLAFCTTENIGIIGMGIGLALIGKTLDNQALFVFGFAAALIHVLNHSLYKSLLFFAAGNIYTKTHTRNMEMLGGLIRQMPHTAIIFLIGALAIGGLPPFNGFVSKFLVYSGFVEAFRNQDIALNALMIIGITILSMAGGVSLLTFTKAFGTIFLGEPRSEIIHRTGEVSLLMRAPLYAIVLLMLLIGVFPVLVMNPVFSIISRFAPAGLTMPSTNITGVLTLVGRASLLLIVLIALLYFIRSFTFRKKPVEITATWACGYIAPGPAMQYTGKSFSKSLAKLFGFITIENKKYKELKTVSIFPSPRTYTSYYLEFFETRIIDPVTRQLLRFFNYFTFIHNGKIQFYVLYGLLFMVILIILSFINVL
ncbi:MAG: proton-conducting transporter membrane subunit [Bacteroidales bacterium]